MRIDFRSLEVTPVALELDGYRLVTLDSGERHANAGGDDDTADGYNQRRAECVRAAELLGVESLRDATLERVDGAARAAARAAPATSSPRTRACRTPSRPCRTETSSASARCSTPRTPACATALPSRPRPWSGPCDAASTPAPSGRGSWAAASAATCSGLMPPDTQPPAGALEVEPGPGARIVR